MPSDPAPLPPVSGTFHAAGTSRTIPAELTVAGQTLILTVGDETRPVPPGYRVNERIAGVARALLLADGGRFVTADDTGFSALLAAVGHRNRGSGITWLERRGWATLAVLTAVTVLLMLSLRLAIPALSQWVARQVPPALERQIGSGSLTTLDEVMFSPSELPEPDRQRITALFRHLRDTAGLPPDVSLEFRRGNRLGANAVALPGGPVVLTDELATLIPQDDALAGVLAHELGHLQARHSLQQMIRSTLWLATVTLYIGDDTGVSDLLGGSAMALIDSGYSRNDERDADTYALTLTARAGFRPDGLATAFEALKADCGPGCDSGSLLSSHPGLSERIDRIRRPDR
ncbi:M48 family metallopeptidase [Novispirillum itersonii]|uniref:M48 family metallopeptidase n=1 Tax=Novispirillum itersonii TaxID=189 RepID=UPI000380E686|nr:M48 family metallopeptidase [Novispirillum itersonii]